MRGHVNLWGLLKSQTQSLSRSQSTHTQFTRRLQCLRSRLWQLSTRTLLQSWFLLRESLTRTDQCTWEHRPFRRAGSPQWEHWALHPWALTRAEFLAHFDVLIFSYLDKWHQIIFLVSNKFYLWKWLFVTTKSTIMNILYFYNSFFRVPLNSLYVD